MANKSPKTKETGLSKILGVVWDEQNDNFIFDFTEICKFSKGLNVTKRNVLEILN